MEIAATALFTLPGVPVMPYGSEIAVNGKEAPESHPISNFKTDMELQEYIGDLNHFETSRTHFAMVTSKCCITKMALRFSSVLQMKRRGLLH